LKTDVFTLSRKNIESIFKDGCHQLYNSLKPSFLDNIWTVSVIPRREGESQLLRIMRQILRGHRTGSSFAGLLTLECYVACATLESGVIQVFSVDLPTWNCKIKVGGLDDDDGVGLEDFVWSSNARNILTTAAHYVQLTVWSISDKEVVHIRDILPVKKNKSFSGSGKLMAIGQFNENYTTCL
ncbi:unnamed protein product, partial [Allacma fusca]